MPWRDEKVLFELHHGHAGGVLSEEDVAFTLLDSWSVQIMSSLPPGQPDESRSSYYRFRMGA
jgi:hypothetical protein